MKIKKLISYLLIAAITLSIGLMGCSPNKQEETQGDIKKSTTAKVEPVKKESLFPLDRTGGLFLPITEEPIEYTMAIAEHPNYAYNKEKFLVIKYLEEWTGVKFKIQPIPNASYHDKVAIMFASGDLPDILPVDRDDSFDGGMEGLLLPIKNLINKHAVNLKKLDETKFKESLKAVTATDGEIYSMPHFIEADPRLTFLFRKDLMDDMGLAIPKTMDEFFTVLRTAKQKYPDMIPFVMRSGKDGGLFKEFAAYDCWVDPDNLVIIEDGKAMFGLEDPMAKKLISDTRILYEEKLMNQNYILGDLTYWEEKILTGNALCTFDWGSRVGNLENKNKAAQKPIEGFTLTRVMPPIPKGGTGYLQERSNIDGKVTAFNKKIKNPEIAIKAIDFLYSDLGMELVQFGVEGVTFTYAEDKAHIINTDMIKNGDKFGPNAIDRMLYGINYPTIQKRTEKALVDVKLNATEDSLNWQKIYTESNFLRPAQPILSITKEENEVWTDKYSACQKYFIENIDKFIMGTRPISDWDKFIQEFYKLGMGDLIKIKQQQYNRAK